MKYVCINNRTENLCYKDDLIIGKIYEIYFVKISNLYELRLCSLSTMLLQKYILDQMFKPLSEFREEKINKILYI